MAIFNSYVKLPEGNWNFLDWQFVLVVKSVRLLDGSNVDFCAVIDSKNPQNFSSLLDVVLGFVSNHVHNVRPPR